MIDKTVVSSLVLNFDVDLTTVFLSKQVSEEGKKTQLNSKNAAKCLKTICCNFKGLTKNLGRETKCFLQKKKSPGEKLQ